MDRVGDPEQEAARVELGLVGQPHGAGDVPGQVDVVDELGGQPGGARGVDLLAQLLHVAVVLGVRVRGPAAEVARGWARRPARRSAPARRALASA